MTRFDGRVATVFTVEDGLAPGSGPLLEDSAGDLWFSQGEHLTRYDGQTFTTYALPARQGYGWPVSMAEDHQGGILLATDGHGVLRYDHGTWTTWGRKEGLADRVWGVLRDPAQRLWFGTYGRGLCRYDGQSFTTYGTTDGLPVDFLLWAALVARNGDLWFGTDGGGAVRYDGRAFQNLDRADGLAGNVVRSMVETEDGSIWFGCSGGITRYRPTAGPPPRVWLDAVVADHRYAGVSDVGLSSTSELVTFEFHAMSFKTRPGGMVYRYRLHGHDPDWRLTRQGKVEYPSLGRGAYTFEVQAVDRDMAYSDPARLRLTIHPPYGQWALAGALGVALVGLALAARYGIRRRHERDQARERLVQELEAELQTAHELQMGLMPKAPPRVAGVSVAGRCLPANHVGGDFYQYFVLPQDRLALCLADVTGHAMEAAIPAVMFDGILDSQVRLGSDPEDLFARLNAVLCEKLTGRTHVAFAMALLDGPRRTVRLANAGCPYPCHYRSATGEVVEVALEAYPLGVRPGLAYSTVGVEMQAGDCVVLYSDGIPEAAGAQGELFGFERAVEALRAGCAAGLPPQGLIDHLVAAVRSFTGEAPQGDDMTCVVLRVES
ncbi:MAG: SpoIIE family protein phosphatase [Candidatus Latescibacterota bacterium]